MASFSVVGPLTIPFTKQKVGRRITPDDIAEFWCQNAAAKKDRGCYMFGFNASKGSKPIYVGKATKSFGQEIFSLHKLNIYHKAFASQARGTPIFYLVCLKGGLNKSAIDEAESYLIQAGLTANKNLLNDKKTKIESWSIDGVVRFKGKVSTSARNLRKCIKL